MRKEISPELYNYNKYPGPDFRLHGQEVVAEGFAFLLKHNVKGAFDATVFSQRFSEILTKFDYIVGDWSNEQLRLKGFYRDTQAVDESLKISRLEDYLMEYCSFGCAYFILENESPRRASFDKKSKPRKEKEEVTQSRKRKKTEYPTGFDKGKGRSKQVHRDRNRKLSQQKKKTSKEESGKRHFVIRQKENN